MRHYIASDPGILNGKLVIAGTRIPISQILFLLKEGYTLQAVHGMYPNVSLIRLEGVLNELASSIVKARHGDSLSLNCSLTKDSIGEVGFPVSINATTLNIYQEIFIWKDCLISKYTSLPDEISGLS